MYAQVDITLLRHRKVRALARELEVSRPEALGILASIWVWALEQAPDGVLAEVVWVDLLHDIGAEDIAAHQLMKALQRTGWVDDDPLRLHDWHKHTGAGIKRRAADAHRKREERASSKAPEYVSDGRPEDDLGTSVPEREDEGEGEDEAEHEQDAPPAPALTRAAVLLGTIDGRGKTTNAGDGELHQLVVTCWAAAVKRDAGRVQLTAKRKAALKKAFNDGYQPSDVLKACEGLALSAWHMGAERGATKKFDDLTYALRDVEKYRELWEERKTEKKAGAIPAWAKEDRADEQATR